MKHPTLEKSSGVLPPCLTLSAIALCLGMLLVGGLFIGFPVVAEHSFGLSSTRLDPFQRAYLSLQLLLQENDLKKPMNLMGESRNFIIQLGESTYDITNRLQTEGLISNAEAMRDYLIFSGLDKTLQAGEYLLNPRMTALEIAHALQDATPTEVTFRVLPGWRTEEIAAALPTSGLSFSPDTFLSNIRDPLPLSPVILEIPPEASLEGYLFPDSYRLPRQIAVDGFIRILLDNFNVKTNSNMRKAFQNQDLTLHQAVTLASIVQREAVVVDEMPLIASVFLNRLSAGMKLGSDPTVQYALGYDPFKRSWWKAPLSLDDLKVDSPYNTYLQPGLPPGPISNPSLSALEAVAYPTQSTYYYFRAACDGSGRHIFAQTFEEHQQNACP